jgi:hypothetical protein
LLEAFHSFTTFSLVSGPELESQCRSLVSNVGLCQQDFPLTLFQASARLVEIAQAQLALQPATNQKSFQHSIKKIVLILCACEPRVWPQSLAGRSKIWFQSSWRAASINTSPHRHALTGTAWDRSASSKWALVHPTAPSKLQTTIVRSIHTSFRARPEIPYHQGRNGMDENQNLFSQEFLKTWLVLSIGKQNLEGKTWVHTGD